MEGMKTQVVCCLVGRLSVSASRLPGGRLCRETLCPVLPSSANAPDDASTTLSLQTAGNIIIISFKPCHPLQLQVNLVAV